MDAFLDENTIGEVMQTLNHNCVEAARRGDRAELERMVVLAGEVEKALAIHRKAGCPAELTELKAGRRVLLPVSAEHARAMASVAALYLKTV